VDECKPLVNGVYTEVLQNQNYENDYTATLVNKVGRRRLNR